MSYDKTNNVSFELILHSGNAKSSAMEAFRLAKSNDFEKAEKKLDEAQEELVKAHEIQTDLIVAEARGEKSEVDILMVHAQDHLNGALIVIDLVTELIDMCKTIAEVKK